MKSNIIFGTIMHIIVTLFVILITAVMGCLTTEHWAGISLVTLTANVIVGTVIFCGLESEKEKKVN